jgi:hypothetical protein
MPLAGFAAARGQLSLVGVFLAGTEPGAGPIDLRRAQGEPAPVPGREAPQALASEPAPHASRACAA